MALLSVVVPCYNEEENVHYFYEELLKNQPFFEEKADGEPEDEDMQPEPVKAQEMQTARRRRRQNPLTIIRSEQAK